MKKFILIVMVILFFTVPAISADITLAWDPNSEEDLVGYKIYYKINSSGSPYNGRNATQGDSGISVTLEEFDNSQEPLFTLTGLSDDTLYYLAVTAYNDSAESGYSNEVNYLTPPAPVLPPPSPNSLEDITDD